MRIVSLAPAATEWLCTLGLQDAIVGRSVDCPDLPAAAVLLGPAGLDGQALGQARPDLLLAGPFDVGTSPIDAALLRASVPAQCEVFTATPRRLTEVLDALASITTLVSKCWSVPDFVGNLRIRVDKVTELWATSLHKPTAVLLHQLSPGPQTSALGQDLIRCAGGQTPLEADSENTSAISWDDVVGAQPEMVLFGRCGADVDATVHAFTPHLANDAWADIPASFLNQVICIDGRLIGRPGARMIDGLEALAGLLHPDRLRPPASDIALRFPPISLDRR